MKKDFKSLCPPGTKVICYFLSNRKPEVHIVKDNPGMMGRFEVVTLSDIGTTSTELLVSKTGWKGNLVPKDVDFDLLQEEQIDWLEG